MHRRSLLPLLMLVSVVAAHGYVRSRTSTGNELRRTDNANIQFLANDQIAAGLTNRDGQTWITADSDPLAALQAALGNWDAVGTANVSFAPLATTAIGQVPDDSMHVFVFSDTDEIRSVLGSALAIARSRFLLTGEFVDTDIVFNPDITITTIQGSQHAPFSTTLAENTFDLESIATHEVGHALGANHSGVLAASMFPRTPPAATFQSKLTEDDIAFVTEVYPAAGALDARGSITGTVTISGGGAATGVLVTAVDTAAGVTIGTLSDTEDGTYELGPLPAGSYIVSAEPVAGPVSPIDFNGFDGFTTDVRPAFFGGVASPQQVEVLAGVAASADLAVEQQPATREIEFIGYGPPEDEGRVTAIGLGVVPLTGGQAVDLVFAGEGIDGDLTENDIQLLAPGLSIRPGSLIEDSFVTINNRPIVRVTVDVAERQERHIGSFAIVKDGELAILSGVLAIEGAEAGPKPVFTSNGIVNAGSFLGGSIAAEMIVSIFGSNLASEVAVATTIPLPTDLAGTTVEVTDSQGRTRLAPLFFVSAAQVNCQIPEGTAPGPATIVISSQGQASAAVQIQVEAVAPGLFSANASGEGVAAAIAVRVDDQGNQTPVQVFDANQKPRVAVPIDLAGDDAVVLLLFGTGFRGFQGSVEVTIGEEPAQVVGVAAQPEFVGLDQINVIIPRSLIGRGEVEVNVTVDGIALNPVTINIQ